MPTKASNQNLIPNRAAGLDRLCQEARGIGLGHMWKDFESKLPDLFVDNATDAMVGVATPESDRLVWVSSPEDLCTALGTGTSTLLILNRHNSWSRIDITIECFSVACHLAEITPYFLHFIVGMGRKFSSQDEDFMSCYSSLRSQNNHSASMLSGIKGGSDDSVWRICYNLRHFERHHRDLEDPWSCRQSALHHSFSLVSGRSTWVVVQPPKTFDLVVSPSPHPMFLHLRYLHAALANWREYLDSFAQQFKLLNQRIAIPNPYHKFNISFSHEQNLHHHRGKLHHARSILNNTKNTIQAIAEHESAITEKQNICPAVHNDFQRKLRSISLETDNYIETSNKLLRISDDLSSMYRNILAFHGQELQHDASLKLAHLAQADAAGNRDMATLADLTYKDSRAVRIATAIAMVYLPVNLVVAFFSSTLVWYGTAVDAVEEHGTSIQVRGEVWIASAAAIALAIATIGWSWSWNWKEQRKPGKKALLTAV